MNVSVFLEVRSSDTVVFCDRITNHPTIYYVIPRQMLTHLIPIDSSLNVLQLWFSTQVDRCKRLTAN